MKMVALGSNGPYSGKSTLADELVKRGYFRVSSDILKGIYAEALTRANPKKPVTVEDIKRDKGIYRVGLQHFADHIGFNDGEPFVGMALESWFEAGMPEKVVYDCVRTVPQIEALEVHGFQMVYVEIDDETRRQRAKAKGVKLRDLKRAMQHPLETTDFGDHPVMILHGDRPVEWLADAVERYTMPDPPELFEVDASLLTSIAAFFPLVTDMETIRAIQNVEEGEDVPLR